MDAYQPCIEVLQELDKILLHYASLDSKSKRAWDRIKWDPERSRVLRDRLVASVSMLNGFYTSLIHDSQVLILEALQRLETDYQGGHREESIASIEQITSNTLHDDEDDDAAWTQILRDLEDVGISRQEAMNYRDIVVDWLVKAVNEGRLLEQTPEPQSPCSLPRTVETALSSLDLEGIPSSDYASRSTIYPVQTTTTLSSQLSPEPSKLPKLSATTTERSEHRPISESGTYAGISSATQPSSKPRPSTTVHMTPESHTKEAIALPVASSEPQAAIHLSPIVRTETPEVLSCSTPARSETLPAHQETDASSPMDLAQTAQDVVIAWNEADFPTAGKHLKNLLAAIECGQTGPSGLQPDRRVIRHLIGVCASFSGDFKQAKRFFESAFNGIYLNRESLDEGDIATALWLGDVCLQLQEHHNAVVAYSVAYEGSIGRFGMSRDRTRRVAAELKLLDQWLSTFARIEQSFQRNIDPTNIFTSTHTVEKSALIASVKAGLCEGKDFASIRRDKDSFESQRANGRNLKRVPSVNQWTRPSFTTGLRSNLDSMITVNFLLNPLISPSVWPLPWDPTFSPEDAVQLDRYMNVVPSSRVFQPLIERQLPTKTLGDSKSLHYVTKRGSEWLILAVKQGLTDMGIEHAEHGYDASIICRLSRHRESFAYEEGVEICFRKLQFRNVYGIKVSDVIWATRNFGTISINPVPNARDTTEFRSVVRDILERAEAVTSRSIPNSNGCSASPQLLVRTQEKR